MQLLFLSALYPLPVFLCICVPEAQKISDIVSDMTKSIGNTNDISKRMLSKYDESATNINSIESVVESLISELGVGGFMGIEDIQPGMKLITALNDTDTYRGEVVSRNNNTIIIKLFKTPQLSGNTTCNLQITVSNVLYTWNNADISADKNTPSQYKVVISSRPIITNRRKYPRVDMSNTCTITIPNLDKTINATLDNISANGFAFTTKDDFFTENKGINISIEIKDFVLPDHNKLNGRVIRCSSNEGMYIIGCQMPADDYMIRDYIEKNSNY